MDSDLDMRLQWDMADAKANAVLGLKSSARRQQPLSLAGPHLESHVQRCTAHCWKDIDQLEGIQKVIGGLGGRVKGLKKYL